jgi:hypothetical protein
MIDVTVPVFPNNVVELLAIRFGTVGVIDPEPDPAQRVYIYKRPLRPSDAFQSIGIAPVTWMPDENSYEIKGGPMPGPSEPTLQRYQINVQAFVRDADETHGLAVHSVLSGTVRSILYRDTPLRVGLGALVTVLSGVTERYKRHGIRLQRYLADEVEGNWVYLSTVEFWIETETV